MTVQHAAHQPTMRYVIVVHGIGQQMRAETRGVHLTYGAQLPAPAALLTQPYQLVSKCRVSFEMSPFRWSK